MKMLFQQKIELKITKKQTKNTILKAIEIIPSKRSGSSNRSLASIYSMFEFKIIKLAEAMKSFSLTKGTG